MEPLGGQGDLLPPAEGGNDLKLGSPEDSRILAETAADTVSLPLRSMPPFSHGAPFLVREPDAVALDVVDAVPAPVYPVIVTPDNEWSKAAVTAQVVFAFDYATQSVENPLAELRFALLCFCAVVLVIQVIFTPVAACGDIQENPKVSMA